VSAGCRKIALVDLDQSNTLTSTSPLDKIESEKNIPTVPFSSVRPLRSVGLPVHGCYKQDDGDDGVLRPVARSGDITAL